MGRFYEVVFEMDTADGESMSWLVTVPSFPEITTFGDNQELALRNAQLAIEEAMSGRISDGEDIPTPQEDTAGVARMVQVSALTFLKSALYMLCKDEGITRAELVRRLDWNRESVDRLFRIDHKSKLSQLEDAFDAIGHPIEFDMPFSLAA